MFIYLAATLAFGNPPAVTSREGSLAAVHQLREELHALAGRQHWGGMTRKWDELQELGAEFSLDELILGAQIERHNGYVAEAYSLLREAARRGAGRDVIDLLWEIDSGYGRVMLTTEPSRPAQLNAAVMPIVPDQRVAVELAQSIVGAGAVFEGMLPSGSYTFASHSFHVSPGPRTVRITVAPLGDE
jgi:hypothetical protein